MDAESTWGYSEHHGWVQGYWYEVVVTAPANGTVWLLLASADTASASEHVTFGEKIEHLGSQVLYVLADSGYDNNQYGERIEWDEEGDRTGKRFLCPENPPGTKQGSRKAKQRPAPTTIRQQRQGRQQRRAFLESRRGQELYARRGQTVEPFHDWWKSLFELEHRVWHRGLDNNRTHLLAAIFAYQVLLRYNHRCGKKNGQVRWVLDML